jgi:hypothetical protein
MRVVTREILGEAGGRRSPGDGCRSYARCGGQHDGLSGLQSQRQDSRFFAKKVIGSSDWPLRCQTPAVGRSLHVKPGSRRNPRNATPTTFGNDFRRRQSSQTLSPGEHRDVDARPANHLATPTSPATLVPHGHSHCPGLSSIWTAEDVQQHTVATL